MASTRAHSGWFTRSCVALPSTNQTKSTQNQYNNHTTNAQQPHNNHTTTVQQPYKTGTRTPQKTAYKTHSRCTCAQITPRTPRAAPVPPPATLRYGAAGEAGGLPEGPPPPSGPQRRRRHHPSPHCATARQGRPVAYPKGRPNPAGPQGRRRRHPSSSCATARRGHPEAYPKGRPYCQKSDPAPPEIGRGSKRALTHRAGKSNRLM